ncbi:MAG TPA: response regulator [Burkholderiales bacterium]|nr:response regulator [Burkholderiales bacterium]
MTQAVTATKKVLVIDDDPVVGKSFDRVLSPKGYAVISAADGEEALAKLASEHYDVVFTDIKMPGMDGLEVAKRIKGSNPWMPVVIVTGYGTEANEMQARQLGVSHFLHKPLTPELIEATATYAYPVAALPAPSVDATVSIAEPEARLGFFKNVGLFIAAPFIGLAYVLVFPFVGLGMLGYVAYQALTQVKTGKNP